MAKARTRTVFFCSQCGTESLKWSGQCGECGEWNSLVEHSAGINKTDVSRFSGLAPDSRVEKLSEVSVSENRRMSSGSAEFDRVLGGGLVPGSVVLVGGDPGIGKSTLLLQNLSSMSTGAGVLYITAEESSEQVAMRAIRLGMGSADVRVMAENSLETILDAVQREKPSVLVADSIQTIYSDALTAAPGSVSQVRECAARLVRYAKQTGCCVLVVGHVTKEGALAGPRVLEHMVDSVLYFEGDTSSSFRMIRAIKNRFGAVNEIGVFAMTGEGLKDVANPSAMFVSRKGADKPGSVVHATQEGSRPLLVEIQALVDESSLTNPRRLCVGLDQNRIAMLLAVAHRHAGIALGSYDVFTNVVGGVRITETGADLAVLLAVISSIRNRPLGRDLVAFGEIGLSGELRPVQRGEERLREAEKLGFSRAVIPVSNKPREKRSKLDIIACSHIDEALQVLD